MSNKQMAPETKGVKVELLATVDLGPKIEGMAAIVVLSLLTLHLALKSMPPPAGVAESYRAVTRTTSGLAE